MQYVYYGHVSIISILCRFKNNKHIECSDPNVNPHGSFERANTRHVYMKLALTVLPVWLALTNSSGALTKPNSLHKCWQIFEVETWVSQEIACCTRRERDVPWTGAISHLTSPLTGTTLVACEQSPRGQGGIRAVNVLPFYSHVKFVNTLGSVNPQFYS